MSVHVSAGVSSALRRGGVVFRLQVRVFRRLSAVLRRVSAVFRLLGRVLRAGE